jgi:hypothetical protein
MTSPDAIPFDVWRAAAAVAKYVECMPSDGNIACIARAILAERERCAKIADKEACHAMTAGSAEDAWFSAATIIARAIRTPVHTPSPEGDA